jgi:hypothetical protein
MSEKPCDLCEAARLTAWFFEDDSCWIAECEICSVPMVVWKQHGPVPPEDVKVHLHAALSQVADVQLGKDSYYIDDVMRQIPNHYHAHARTRAHPFPSILSRNVKRPT